MTPEQHPGLAEELRAIDEAPMPAQTPPPRLTEDEMMAIRAKAGADLSAFCRGESEKRPVDCFRAIETAVRKQFGVNDE